MPVSFSSFLFQTMKFLWTLTRLWSHMDLALREPGWLLDQTLVFLNTVIGKADVDFSLLIRNKVEQSKWWCLLLHSIAQTEEGHLRMHINHTGEKLWDCNSFLLLLFGFKPQKHCLVGWPLCNTSDSCTGISSTIMVSASVTRLEGFFFNFISEIPKADNLGRFHERQNWSTRRNLGEQPSREDWYERSY